MKPPVGVDERTEAMVRGASDGADSSHPYGLGFATTGALLNQRARMT
jgi:hypothetical protein